MASETESSADEEAVAVPAAGAGGTDKRGRHRILAELKRLDQDSKFLQVSTLCSLFYFIIFFNFENVVSAGNFVELTISHCGLFIVCMLVHC